MRNFMKKYGAHLAALLLVGAGVASMISASTQSNSVTHPKTGPEFAKTSAMVLSKDKKHGGSGVILHSNKTGSLILTNKHVCEVVQTGGYVKTTKQLVKVQAYKIYSKHDLCMISVKEDLGIKTQLAPKAPALHTLSTTSGHPSLLPSINSPGTFTDEMQIQLIVGIKPCDGEETGLDAQYCAFYGKKPITKTYDSQVVSSLIMAGSSGSAVFDENGNIAGLVFAGSPDGLSYGFIVPHRFLLDFIVNHEKYKWRKVNSKATPKQFMKTVVGIRESCRAWKEFIPMCKDLSFQSIWSR